MDQPQVHELKKKIAVLRKAIFKERADNQTDLNEIEELQKKIEILDQILQEKDAQIESYQAEKKAIEEQLAGARGKAQPAPLKPTKQNLELLEQHNKKLLEDYHFLKQENADLQRMHETLAAEYEQVRQASSSEDEGLRQTIEELNNTLAEALRQQETIEREIKDAQYSNTQLKATNERLDQELASLKDSHHAAEAEVERLEGALVLEAGPFEA